MNHEIEKFKGLSVMKAAVAWVVAAASVFAANANRGHDANVTALANSVAHSGFPKAAARMPAVLVCDGNDFGPNIGGDYTSGIHRIRIPYWQLSRAELRSVLAHELAHAEAWLSGGNEGNNGHSTGFMLALLRAGWHDEALRVAQYASGGQFALNQARASLYGQGGAGAMPPGVNRPPAATPPTAHLPPTVLVQVCHDEQFAVYRQIGLGSYQMEMVSRRICQCVPAQ